MRHWLWASFLLTSSAYALNLGEIIVSSAFDEPLVATVPLELSPGTTVADYQISLQGLPAGVPPLVISVVPGKQNLIKLTSKEPLTHNYIQFDLLARAKNEELRQAYLITFNKKQAAKTKSAPKPLVYGPVKEGETLWHVAKAFSDHYNIPIDQAMEQLHDNNPRAFGNNKKDGLLAGSYLRLPKTQAKTETQAKTQVPAKTENLAKKTTPAPKEPTKEAVKEPSKNLKEAVKQEVAAVLPELPKLEEEGKAIAANLNKVTGSLELLVPTPSVSVPVSDTLQSILGQDDHAFVALLDKIQSELAMSREAINTEREAKQALQNQLNEMQIQIKALTELIHLKDKEMKTLLMTGTSRPIDEASWNRMPEGATSLLARAGENQLVLLLMAVAVASALVYLGDHLAARRNRRKPAMTLAPAGRPSSIKAQPLQPAPFLLQDIDVYVARGRYSQAEDMLEQVLAQNPNDFDLLYKLFQVYVKSDNRLAYETKISRISTRWKQKFPTRWKRVQDLYERAWPMGFEGHGSGGGGDEAYEGDPPSDPVQTKLDLARAYIDIGNHENAVEILMEVVNEGNEAQVVAAQMLLSNIKH